MTTTVTVLRRTTSADRYGDEQPTGTATRIDVPGCAVAPRTSIDLISPGRNGIIEGLTLYAPPTADIVETDQVEIGTVVYDIVGAVGKWTNPFTAVEAGLEMALTRGSG